MTQKFYLLSKSLLTKIALVAALMSWGGIAAEADTWKISFESQTIPEGWTGSARTYGTYAPFYTLVDGVFAPDAENSTPTLTSNEAKSLTSTQKIIIKAKADGTSGAYVSLKTSLTTTFPSSSTKFEANKMDYTSDYTTLIVDNLSTGDYYLQFQAFHASIESIELVDSYDYVVDEDAPMYILPTGSRSFTIKYTARVGWNTIVLPFIWSDYKTDLFGSSSTFYSLNSYSEDVLEFSKASVVTSNTPYLVYAPNATGIQNNVSVINKSVTPSAHSTTKNGITFQGAYAPMPAGSLVGKYGVTSEGKLAKGGSGAWMKGYRAYLTGLPTGASARIIVIDGDDETTDIGGLAQIVDDEILGKGGSKAPRAYNLQGQQVRNGKKGIYIVNGKKIVVK